MIKKPEVDIRDKGFSNLPQLSDAIKIATENIRTNDTELINLREQGDFSIRILAEDIYAKYFVPNFTRATMDGFAIRSSDVVSTTSTDPISLKVVKELEIGIISDIPVQEGTAIKIPTGGALPDGADSVIKIEDVKITNENSDYSILVDQPIESGKNVSHRGEDFKKGELIFKQGRLLTPIDIGVILSIGISTVKCFKVPKIGILSTGDEIVDEDRELKPGEVYDTNSYVLFQYLKHLGFKAKRYTIMKDNYDSIKNRIVEIISENDVILTTGGTSVGKKDFIPLIIDELSNVLVHGISIKPGSPTTLGIKDDKLFIGLPGFPVSSLISFAFFGMPILLHQMRANKIKFFSLKASLTEDFDSIIGRTDFLRVMVKNTKDQNLVYPLKVAGSSLLSTLSQADGIVIINDKTEKILKNSIVDVFIIDKLANE